MRRLGRCGRARKKKFQNQGSNSKSDVAQANLPQFVQLQMWLKPQYKRGKSLNALLKPCDFKGTGRGLQATRKIQPGDTIVSIPMKHLITVHTALASVVGSYITRSQQKFTPQQILTTFLVIESCMEESPWKPYFKSLPDVYSTPLYFSSADIRLLKPLIRKQAEGLRERFSRAAQSITNFIELNTPWFSHYFTKERICWAWSTVDTRSVYLYTYPHPSFVLDPEESNVALAPFLDLLNHTDTAKMTADVNTKSQSYEIITEDSFKKYDQVFICYGAYDNAKLLINYGFVLTQNINNTYVFTMDNLVSCVPASSGHIERKVDILQEANLQRNLVCSMDGLSWSLSTALKIVLLPWKLLSKWKLLLQGASLGEDNERESQRVAVVLIKAALHDATEHLDDVKRHPQGTHHKLLLRLAQDDVDILNSTLTTLKEFS
ncbi:hypothetical protein RRG08_063291 [Elysia crispata]|uniref:SET domain-containing protein n=1 Tax=Elysia crispata TaxID=231223 RepID=A0AAE0XP93_9GAST|nr:hypothetical protein RRG08_063291 [Elysia crispata]